MALRNKYKVSAKEDRTYDGIVFDSKAEMKYYRDVVLPGVANGTIVDYQLQKPYELQPKFKYYGKTVRAITYVCDFYLVYADGHTEVIDIKGMATTEALLKRKLFMYTRMKTVSGWWNARPVGYDMKIAKNVKNREAFMTNKIMRGGVLP